MEYKDLDVVLTYPCGNVEHKHVMAMGYLRGTRYRGKRPIKIDIFGIPQPEFLFKSCAYILDPRSDFKGCVSVHPRQLDLAVFQMEQLLEVGI